MVMGGWISMSVIVFKENIDLHHTCYSEDDYDYDDHYHGEDDFMYQGYEIFINGKHIISVSHDIDTADIYLEHTDPDGIYMIEDYINNPNWSISDINPLDIIRTFNDPVLYLTVLNQLPPHLTMNI
jgi:hypothetical protein